MITIEVWSDINCPFCYIGKRHLEKALLNLGLSQTSKVIWKSFELDPHASPVKGTDNADMLAKKYGKDRAWAIEMNENITQMALGAGLEFHMEKVIPANSFNAHRILHLAKEEGKQDEMKEKLLSAKFIEGKDIGDVGILSSLARELGISAPKISGMFETDEFEKAVRKDESTAHALGIHGVPYFIVNKTLALSGAQPVEVFVEVLEKAQRDATS